MTTAIDGMNPNEILRSMRSSGAKMLAAVS
jgi:hypothetical protein